MILSLKLAVAGAALGAGLLVSPSTPVQSAQDAAPLHGVGVASKEEQPASRKPGQDSTNDPCGRACSVGEVFAVAPR